MNDEIMKRNELIKSLDEIIKFKEQKIKETEKEIRDHKLKINNLKMKEERMLKNIAICECILGIYLDESKLNKDEFNCIINNIEYINNQIKIMYNVWSDYSNDTKFECFFDTIKENINNSFIKTLKVINKGDNK